MKRRLPVYQFFLCPFKLRIQISVAKLPIPEEWSSERISSVIEAFELIAYRQRPPIADNNGAKSRRKWDNQPSKWEIRRSSRVKARICPVNFDLETISRKKRIQRSVHFQTEHLGILRTLERFHYGLICAFSPQFAWTVLCRAGRHETLSRKAVKNKVITILHVSLLLKDWIVTRETRAFRISNSQSSSQREWDRRRKRATVVSRCCSATWEDS